jgi:hypothetical protein
MVQHLGIELVAELGAQALLLLAQGSAGTAAG